MRQAESSGRRHIRTLTFWVVVAAPFALVGVAFAALTRAQQGVLRDWLWSVLVLCPLVLCFLPVYLLMLVLGQVAMPRAARARRRGMRTAREGGLALQGRVRELSEQLPPAPADGEIQLSSLFHKDEE